MWSGKMGVGEKKQHLEEIFKNTDFEYFFSYRSFILEIHSLIWNAYA